MFVGERYGEFARSAIVIALRINRSIIRVLYSNLVPLTEHQFRDAKTFSAFLTFTVTYLHGDLTAMGLKTVLVCHRISCDDVHCIELCR